MSAWLFAFLGPLAWALMNTLDKYVLAKKVRQPLSFAIVVGISHVVYGLLIALFLDWSSVSMNDMLWPFLAGYFLGMQLYVYFFLLQKEDASYVIGFMYTYPILISLLSYIFLGEIVSVFGYIGMLLIIMGAIMLSVRLKKITFRFKWWAIALMVILVALYEFLIKVATTKIPVANGLAINGFAVGIAILPALISVEVRKSFFSELRNIGWAFLNEGLTFVAVICTYIAMKYMPATIVASIGAIQPLAVMMFEKIASFFGGDIERDKALAPKLFSIILIAIGVALIYLFSA
jgi:drug/metabolite transporter (DMT)-like permease